MYFRTSGVPLVGSQVLAGLEHGRGRGLVAAPIDLALFQVGQGDPVDGRLLVLQGLFGVGAPVVGGADDQAVREGLLAGCREEAVDVSFLQPVVFRVELALHGMEFAGGGPGHQIDPGVLRVDPLFARPVGVHPDVLVEVLVARLVGEVALDEPLEVGPLLTLALG